MTAGQSGRERRRVSRERGDGLFFKFAFMKIKRSAVSATHAKAQLTAKPALFRLGRRDTDEVLQSRKIDKYERNTEGKASHRNVPLYVTPLSEESEF